MDPGITPTGMSTKYWKNLDQKAKSTIQLCLSYSILLNVSGKATSKALWDKLGTLHQSKYLVSKIFLQNKLNLLRMNDGDSVIEHLNAFNIVVGQLFYIDIKIYDEDKRIILLCSLSDSSDGLVAAIGSNATTTEFDDMVSSLLSEEMRWKTMDG